MRVRTLALFALVALALAAAGCGGSDSNSAAEATDTTTTEVTTTDETATDTTGGYGSSTDETTTESTSTDESTATETGSTDTTAGLGDLSGECLEFASVGLKYSEALQQASGAGGDLSESTKLFEEFAKAAPEEIRPDLELMAKSVGTYAEALKGLDLSSGKPPTAEQIAKLEEISKKFNSADLQKASQHIQAWVTKNCSKS